VVTPSKTPKSKASCIWARFAVSTKNFILLIFAKGNFNNEVVQRMYVLFYEFEFFSSKIQHH
jgi:hypothetical protein